MQQAISNEGYLIPSQSKNNMLLIQKGTWTTGSVTNKIAIPGTILFNTDTANGGSPNGQLWVLLKDGSFHPIMNA